MWTALQKLQRGWFLNVNELARHTAGLHGPLRFYAEYGVVLFAGLLALGWWLARRDRDPRTMAAAHWAPVGTLIAFGLNQPLGNRVGEPRPYTIFPHALTLVARSSDFSFPSDHAVMAGGVAAGLFLGNRRLGVVAGAAAVAIAVARVYVGAHFPLDVAAGLLFGAMVTVAGRLLVRRTLSALLLRAADTRLRWFICARAEVNTSRNREWAA